MTSQQSNNKRLRVSIYKKNIAFYPRPYKKWKWTEALQRSRLYIRRWIQDHPEEYRQRLEKAKETRRLLKETNPEKYRILLDKNKASSKRWRVRNPQKYQARLQIMKDQRQVDPEKYHNQLQKNTQTIKLMRVQDPEKYRRYLDKRIARLNKIRQEEPEKYKQLLERNKEKQRLWRQRRKLKLAANISVIRAEKKQNGKNKYGDLGENNSFFTGDQRIKETKSVRSHIRIQEMLKELKLFGADEQLVQFTNNATQRPNVVGALECLPAESQMIQQFIMQSARLGYLV